MSTKSSACTRAGCANLTRDPSRRCHHHRAAAPGQGGISLPGRPLLGVPPSPGFDVVQQRMSHASRTATWSVVSLLGAGAGAARVSTVPGYDIDVDVALVGGQHLVMSVGEEPGGCSVMLASEGSSAEHVTTSAAVGQPLLDHVVARHPHEDAWQQTLALAHQRAGGDDVRLQAPASWNAAGALSEAELDYALVRAGLYEQVGTAVRAILDEDSWHLAAEHEVLRSDFSGSPGGPESKTIVAARDAFLERAASLGYPEAAGHKMLEAMVGQYGWS